MRFTLIFIYVVILLHDTTEMFLLFTFNYYSTLLPKEKKKLNYRIENANIRHAYHRHHHLFHGFLLSVKKWMKSFMRIPKSFLPFQTHVNGIALFQLPSSFLFFSVFFYEKNWIIFPVTYFSLSHSLFTPSWS